MLILTCISFHGKVQLYVAYRKMKKYPNDTILIGFVLFTEIGIFIFVFMCRSHL